MHWKIKVPVLCPEQFHGFPKNPRFYCSHVKNHKGHFVLESHGQDVSQVLN